MKFEFGIAEPVAEFGDLRLVAIIQVLTRAEDLDCADTGLLDSAEQGRRQAMIHEQVGRQYVIH